MEEIKRRKRELVYQGAVLNVYRDQVELPNGNVAEWDYIHHDGAAAVVPVTEDGKILMVRQYRNALDRATLEIPAGKLDDPKEEGIVCAKRELEEETGFRSEQLEWLITLRTTVAFCNERIEIFVAKNLIPTEQHLDEDEFVEVEAYTMEELKEKGLWFVCADMDGDVMYRVNLKGPIGLVIGNEGEGVGRLVKETCDMTAAIPMRGDIDSLNASVAAGVLAYEIVRQRMS